MVQRLGKGVYELRISENETREAHSDHLKLYHLEGTDTEGIPLFYDHTDPPTRPPLQVDRIRTHRQTASGWEFLVHWKGAPNSRDSWEPPTSFLALCSPEWLAYCQDHALFLDLHDLPTDQGAYPRVTPWDDPIW